MAAAQAPEDPLVTLHRSCINIRLHLLKEDQDPAPALDALDRVFEGLFSSEDGVDNALYFDDVKQEVFMRQLFPHVIKAVLRRKHYPVAPGLDGVLDGQEIDRGIALVTARMNSVLARFARLAAIRIREKRQIGYVIPLLDVLFDEKQHLYQQFGFQEPPPMEPDNPQTAEWRAQLGVSDWIDAIKVDRNNVNKKEWSLAQVMDEKESHLNVSFAGASDFYNRWIRRSSAEIAPMGHMVKLREPVDGEWLQLLDEGSICDCRDAHGRWYNSTIVGVKTSKIAGEMDNMRVGFRIYLPHGASEDDIGCFNGYDQTLDEWVPRNSTRFNALNTKAPTHLLPPEECIDDEKDVDDPSMYVYVGCM